MAGSEAGARPHDFGPILTLLRETERIDFSLYRQATIERRVISRMALHGLESLEKYIELLRQKPSEIEALYQDILIKVTHFFRDPEVFDTLKEQVYPALLKARVKDAPIRIWVPGCSTGEEAYSLAISLSEVLLEQQIEVPVEIFATDVSEAVLERARAGVYPATIAADVTPERLQRFFSKTRERYRISRSIRDMCVFAKQNIIRDPPISRLDLISCRNVLIYFEPALQKKILPVLHHALKPTGFLLLGTCESAAGASGLFNVVDKKSKVHAKAAVDVRPRVALAGILRKPELESAPRLMQRPTEGPHARSNALKDADRIIMSRYTPAGVVIDADMQIVQFRGHTGPFLEPCPGEANLHILKMARGGLLFELRAALHEAKLTNTQVRVEGVHVNDGGRLREVNIDVSPLREGREEEEEAWPAAAPYFLVLFEEPDRRAASATDRPPAREGGKQIAKSRLEHRLSLLEQELSATKDYLQTIIEAHETTNEELQTANEELLASNEELQNINEELDIAKEELLSANEELSTINQELEHRNEELGRITDDLGNLLASVDIPIVMLSRDLRIRHFTPQAERVFHLIPGDRGRLIGSVKPRINIPDLEPRIAAVISRGSAEEREVQDHEGRWYSMRIRPYRTAENRVQGAVICLIDIDDMKKQSLAAEAHPQKTKESRGAP